MYHCERCCKALSYFFQPMPCNTPVAEAVLEHILWIRL